MKGKTAPHSVLAWLCDGAISGHFARYRWPPTTSGPLPLPWVPTIRPPSSPSHPHKPVK